jgi:hypothetical protein
VCNQTLIKTSSIEELSLFFNQFFVLKSVCNSLKSIVSIKLAPLFHFTPRSFFSNSLACGLFEEGGGGSLSPVEAGVADPGAGAGAGAGAVEGAGIGIGICMGTAEAGTEAGAGTEGPPNSGAVGRCKECKNAVSAGDKFLGAVKGGRTPEAPGIGTGMGW